VNISHTKGRKTITNMTGQEKRKHRRESDEPIRVRKISSMINSVNQKNVKVNNAKKKEQSTCDSTWEKSNRNRNQ
jgi:hypothetical protein